MARRLKLWDCLFVVLVILGIVILLQGCAEVETKYIVDYRYNEPRNDVVTEYTYKYNIWKEERELVPDTHTVYVPESYELMWEYIYDNGHKERKWEKCTRFEYEDARKELGNG